MDVWVAETRLALRTLRRRPGGTLLVVATLALGLGANTAVYSVLRSVLIAPLPYDAASRLVRVYGTRRDRPGDPGTNFLTGPATTELRDEIRSIEAVAILDNYSPEAVDLTAGSTPRRVRMLRVSGGYFDVFEAAPLAGRAIRRADETADNRVVVLRAGTAREAFGGEAGAVGRSVTLDGVAFTVIGVMSDAVVDPLEGRIDLWLPADLTGRDADNWDNNYLTAVIRLTGGADLTTLRAELDVVEARHDAINEDAAEKGYRAVPLHDDLVGSARPALMAMMGAVGFLLLLTCVNVAGLLLVSAAARERDVAIRTSLGAPRRRLIRLFVIETAMLSVAGGLAGLGAGWVALKGLLHVAPAELPRRAEIAMGGDAVVLAAAAAAVIAIVLGLATALPFTKPRLGQVVSGSRTGGSTRRHSRVRGVLVSVEVALAVVLLVGAGVLLRTVHELRARDLGAEPAGVLTFEVGLPTARYPDAAAGRAFLTAFHARARSVPGVLSVAATSRLPVTGSFNSAGGRPAIAVGEPADIDNVQVNQRFVTDGFFHTAGLDVIRGRTFGPQDGLDAPRTIVVNQTLARRLYPDSNPVGRLLYVSGRYAEIVGVVEDEALTARGAAAPMAYHSLRQRWWGGGTLHHMVRVEGDALASVPALRAALAEVDPNLVLYQPTLLQEVVGAGLAQERFAATTLTTFGILALFLAGLGLYGVLSQLVGSQRHEIGVRMALGASEERVRGMVVGRGVRLTLIGTLAGVIMAAALTRLLRVLLFEVSTHDPVVFAFVPLLLVGIALASSYLPAVRATRVDPAESFRTT